MSYARDTIQLVFENTEIIQALRGNFWTVNHGLNKQFVVATVAFEPESGTYQDKWINAEGTLTIEYLDTNNIVITNDSLIDVAIGKAKVIVQR